MMLFVYSDGVRAVIPRHPRPGYPATVNCDPAVSSISTASRIAAVRNPEVSHA